MNFDWFDWFRSRPKGVDMFYESFRMRIPVTIFTRFMSDHDVAMCRQICKTWKNLFTSDVVWKDRFESQVTCTFIDRSQRIHSCKSCDVPDCSNGRHFRGTKVTGIPPHKTFSDGFFYRYVEHVSDPNNVIKDIERKIEEAQNMKMELLKGKRTVFRHRFFRRRSREDPQIEGKIRKLLLLKKKLRSHIVNSMRKNTMLSVSSMLRRTEITYERVISSAADRSQIE